LTHCETKEMQMKTVEEILNAIHTIQDQEELRKINETVKLRFTYLARRSVYKFTVGNQVRFTARGQTVMGEITKINQKNVKVKELKNGFANIWNVPASMLEAV
jgi:hypothetical protein